jgi:hypothetical protein
VRYLGNPEVERQHMSLELMGKIISDMVAEKDKPDGIVSPTWNFIYTCHYNEVLLYKHFEGMLSLFGWHGIKTMILSNGIALTPEKTDIIANYDHVVGGQVCLNIPAFEPDLWHTLVYHRTTTTTGAPDIAYDYPPFSRLMENVKYAVEKLPRVSIQINCQPDTAEQNERQKALAKEMFPKANVFLAVGMHDRAGLLADLGNGEINNRADFGKIDFDGVYDCRNTFPPLSGRHYGWLHVSPTGKAFICCNDFKMEHVFGDFTKQNLADFWYSDKHAEVIKGTLDGLCRRCCMASWRAVR